MSTSTPTIIPCLWLDDQAEAAARFYVETFPGGRVVATSRYPETRDNPGGKPRGSVMTVEVEVAGFRLTLLDGGPQFTINPSISFFVHAADPPEADQLFARLEDGGQVLMPIGSYPWSERFGWVKDRYGVSWQVIVGPRGPAGATIAPCLMFSGAQAGNATAAMEAYAATFPDSRVDTVAHYGPGEGPETYVKHARFVLAGHDLVAMDSHVEHGFGFDEGVSLQVMCADQAEIDRYWAALTEGRSGIAQPTLVPPERLLREVVAEVKDYVPTDYFEERQLAPLDRDVLVARDIEGLTAPEAAQQTGLTVSAVKSRLHRARRQVRAALTAAAVRVGSRSFSSPASGASG